MYHSVVFALLYFSLTSVQVNSESTVNAVSQVQLSPEPRSLYARSCQMDPMDPMDPMDRFPCPSSLDPNGRSMDVVDEALEHDPRRCHELLMNFSQSSSNLVCCAGGAARPVRLCERCYKHYRVFSTVYSLIEQNNTGCEMSILQSDQLQVVFHIASFLQDLWFRAKCQACLVNETQGNETHSFLAPWTLSFLHQLNQTRMCFNSFGEPLDKQHEGNSTVCTNCSDQYGNLSNLYTRLEKNLSLCMDLRDAMNITRREWSKTFGCTVPIRDTIPVILVSLFLCFLPAIFYLSSFLHTKQKTRRLIMPKRFRPTGNEPMFEER